MMSFLKAHILKIGYNLVLHNEKGEILEKQYVSFKTKEPELPKLSKTDYILKGWTQDSNNNELIVTSNINPQKLRLIKLYPVFIRKEVYIMYHSSDSIGGMNDDIVLSGEKVKLTKNTFIREGYSFLGWTTKRNSRNIEYKDEQTVTIENDLELYAVWYSYKITYISIVNKKKQEFIDYLLLGERKQLKNDLRVENGYTFLGWDPIPDVQQPKYKAGQFVINLTKNNEIKLYAIWEIKQNIVMFDSNGGFGTMNNLTTTKDSLKLPKNIFYRNGYQFKGWVINKKLKTVKYKDQDNIIFDNGTTEIKLYAVWKLIFDEEYFGLTNSMSKQEKISKLNKDYQKYNNLIISSNPEKRQEAKAVIEGISALRLILKGE